MSEEEQMALRKAIEKAVVITACVLRPGSLVYVDLLPIWQGSDEGAKVVAECLRSKFFEATVQALEEHKSWK